MAFLEEMSAGFHVGYEVCTLANHCARNDTDALVRDLLEAIDRHRYICVTDFKVYSGYLQQYV